WCLPLLPGVLLADSDYFIGPLSAGGSIKLIPFSAPPFAMVGRVEQGPRRGDYTQAISALAKACHFFAALTARLQWGCTATVLPESSRSVAHSWRIYGRFHLGRPGGVSHDSQHRTAGGAGAAAGSARSRPHRRSSFAS